MQGIKKIDGWMDGWTVTEIMRIQQDSKLFMKRENLVAVKIVSSHGSSRNLRKICAKNIRKDICVPFLVVLIFVIALILVVALTVLNDSGLLKFHPSSMKLNR